MTKQSWTIKSLLVTFIGLCLYLISASVTFAQPEAVQIQEIVHEGLITNVIEETIEPYDESQKIVKQLLSIRITSGDKQDQSLKVPVNLLIGANEPIYKTGDRILLNQSLDPSGESLYYVIDYLRRDSLIGIFLVFVVFVVSIARWRGVMSLIGLAISFIVIFNILLPGLQSGYDPILVTILSSIIIIAATFFLSHGFNEKTAIAAVSTTITLIIVGLMAALFSHTTRLNGYASEEATSLQFLKGGRLDIHGLMLAGIIISSLGILDDITVSQAAIVQEIKAANKKLSQRSVFKRAMRVGQDHIASLVNTLVLVYAGASLPLLMLFTLDVNRNFSTVISYGIVAEEIVRTLVTSLGLVLAVPITTILASKYTFKSKATSTHKH